MILFNILQPAGWQVGLVRVEDVALGCAVSLVVGLLFWPRGAAAALGRALAEAYTDSARYLAAAVEFGMGRCDRGTPTRPAADERGDRRRRGLPPPRRRLPQLPGRARRQAGRRWPRSPSLVTGVAGLRLAADAVLDLWQRDDGRPGGDRAAARRRAARRAPRRSPAGTRRFAASLVGGATVPEPLAARRAGRRPAGRRGAPRPAATRTGAQARPPCG